MGKKPSLSSEKRAQIVTLSKLNFSVREIARKVKVSKTAMHNAITKYQNEDIFTDRKRSGRPKVTSRREDRHMHKVVTRSLVSFSIKIQAKLVDTSTVESTKTIQRKLSLEFGIKSCKPARKPRLTESMKKKRLDFAKRHADWNTEIWKRVLFSDESSVSQFSVRKYRVWRPAGA